VSLSIRLGSPDDRLEILRLFDGALLETDAERLTAQLSRTTGCILVATRTRPVGAVALWTAEVPSRPPAFGQAVHITAIAVRTQRQGDGVGRRLIRAASEWATPRPLSATFDERVQAFYTACEFDITEHAGRLWATRPPAAD